MRKKPQRTSPTHRRCQLGADLSVSESAAIFQTLSQLCVKVGTRRDGGERPQGGERSDTRVLCSDLHTSAVLCANT